MDASKPKKKRSELELLLGHGEAGSAAFSARLPALSISSPSAPDGNAESDEQIARRLHEELNGTRITRRGSKAVPEDHTCSSPTSARGISSPHARPKADAPGSTKGVAPQAATRIASGAPPTQPSSALEAPCLASAHAGAAPSDTAADAGAVEAAAEVVKRKRNTVPARELHLLLQQASSTSGRAETALSPTRSTRGTTLGIRTEPSAAQQATSSGAAAGNPTGAPKVGGGNGFRPEPSRAQTAAAQGAGPALDSSSSGRTAPPTASLAPPPPPSLPPRLKQCFLAGISPSGSAPPVPAIGRPSLPSTSDNGKGWVESARAPDASCATTGGGRTAGGGAIGHVGGSASAVTPSGLLGAARDSLLSGVSLEGCSMQSHCQSNVGNIAIATTDPGSTVLQTTGPPLLPAAATGASIGGCSSTDETENDQEAEAAVGVTGVAAPSATSPKAPPPLQLPSPGREPAASLSTPSTAGGSAVGQAAETGAQQGSGQQGPVKVPKLPMIRAGRAWYRGRLIRESSDGARVLVEVPGAPANQGSGTQQQPFWLPVTSDRIWRGSYKGKDWRYLGDGAWEPKPGAFKRGKQGFSSNGLPLPLPSWAVEGAPPPQPVEDLPASRSKRERERERASLKEEAPADAQPQLQSRASREAPSSRSQRSQRRSTTPAPAPEPPAAPKDSAVPSAGDEAKVVSGAVAGANMAVEPAPEIIHVKDEAADAVQPQVVEPRAEASLPPCAGGSASNAPEVDGQAQGAANTGGVDTEAAATAAEAEVGKVVEEAVEAPHVAAAEASIAGARGQASNAGQTSDANPGVDSPVLVEPASNVAWGRTSEGGRECEGQGEGVPSVEEDDEIWVPGVSHPRSRVPRRARARQQRLRTPLDGLQRLFGHLQRGLVSGDESADEGDGAGAGGGNAGASDAELGGRRGSGDGMGGSYLVGRRRAAARAAAVAAAAARAEAEAEEEELEEMLLGRRPPRRDKFTHVHGLYQGGVAAKRNHHHQHHYHTHSAHHRSRSGARADSNLNGDSSGGLDDVSMGDAAGQGNGQSGRHRGGRSHSQPAVDYGTNNGPAWEVGTWQQHAGAHARAGCAAGGAQGHAPPRNRRKGKPCRSRMDGEGEPWSCWDDDYEQHASGGVWARMPEALRQLYYLPAPAAGGGGGENSGGQQHQHQPAAGEDGALAGKGSREQGHGRSSGGGSYYGAPPPKRRRVYDDSLATGSPDEVDADDAEGDADYQPPYGNSNRRSSVISGRRCSANGTTSLPSTLPGRHGLWVTDQIHHRSLYCEPQRLTVVSRAASAPVSAITELGTFLDPIPPRRHILVSCGTLGGWTAAGQPGTSISGADPGGGGVLGGRGGSSGGACCVGGTARRSIPSGLAGLLEAALGQEAHIGDDLVEDHPTQSGGQQMLHSDGGNGGGGLGAAQAFGLVLKREVLGAAVVGGELTGRGGGAIQQRQESHHTNGTTLAPQAKDTHAAHVALSDSSVNHSGEGEAVGAEGKAAATTPATARGDGAILSRLDAGGGSGIGASAPGCPSGCPSPPAIQQLPMPYTTGGSLAAIAGGNLSPSALQPRPGTPTRARRTGRPPSIVLGAGAPLPKLPALSSSASVRLQAVASTDGSGGVAVANDVSGVIGLGGVLAPQHLRCTVPPSSCDPQQLTPSQPYSTLQHGRLSHDAAYGNRASPDADPMDNRSMMRMHASGDSVDPLPSGDIDPSLGAEAGLWHAGSEGIIARSLPPHPPLPMHSAESSVGALSSAPSAGGPLGCASDVAAPSTLGLTSMATGGCSPVGLGRRVSSCGLGTVSDAPTMPVGAASLGPSARGAAGGGGSSGGGSGSGCGVMDALEVLLLEQQPVMRQLAVQAQLEVDSISFAAALAAQQQPQQPPQHHRRISRQMYSFSSMDEQQQAPQEQEQQLVPMQAQRSGSVPEGLLAALPSVEVVVNLFSTRTAPYGSAQQALADMVGGAAAIPLFQ